ncbi:MAG TPA: DUF4184 family protein [Steroidobacteraceae bacterium]|nr:DUF4184 family protein [Steroidobacteraceae bacterium]
MPFTLAHPAAILPLRQVRFLRTAPLVIGAVTPDVPYYLPLGPGGHPLRVRLDTHSLIGSCTVDLALGLVLLMAAVLLREPLTALLPARARWLCLEALAPFRRRAAPWLLAPLAILIGVWSHLLWDSFTHTDGWAVRHLPALSDTVTIGWYTGEIFHILQYLSSALGLIILMWWYRRLPVPPGALAGQDSRRARAGPALLLIAGAALLIGGVEALRYYSHSEGAIYQTLDVLLTRGLAWFVMLHLFAGAVVTLEHRAGAARSS